MHTKFNIGDLVWFDTQNNLNLICGSCGHSRRSGYKHIVCDYIRDIDITISETLTTVLYTLADDSRLMEREVFASEKEIDSRYNKDK